MAENRLTIININNTKDTFSDQREEFPRTGKNKEMRAKFERLWLLDPERFNPLRNCMERERLDRTWQLLTKHSLVKNKVAADIGCGLGCLSRRLRDAEAKVHAIDIAENAFKRFKVIDAEHIELIQETMPHTSLPDQSYDIIVCTELIAELSSNEYRLFFAELSRLIKEDGYLICSSPIDINSMGGVERLIELSQTEFDIIGQTFSHHKLHLRLKHIFEIPLQFIADWEDSTEKQRDLVKRKGLNYWWFWLNSMPLFVWFWYPFIFMTGPLRHLLNQNRNLLFILEKISRFYWDEDGISHYLFIAKRRPFKMLSPESVPIEKRTKKEIWE